jgi:O-antigen/teichoic acid export membrane protein
MSLARKTGIVVLGRVMTTAVDLVTAIAIVRLLSKTDFAIVSYLLIVYQTGRYLATLGFPDSVFYFFERVTSGARRAFALQTFLILAVTATVAAIGIGTMRWWAPWFLSEGWTAAQIQTVQSLAPLVSLAALLEIPTWPVTNMLLALDRQRDAAAYELSTSVLTFAGLIVPLLIGLPMVWSIYGLLAYAAIRFAGSVIWMARVLPAAGERLPAGWIREQIRFSASLGLSFILTRLNKIVDKFVVSAMLPAAALADYSVGAQEIPIVTVIPFAVGSVLMSRYVRLAMENRTGELIELWGAAIRRSSLVVVPVGLFFIFFARDFILTVFGPTYEAAVLPFQIYTVIVLHRVTSYFGLMQAFGDTRSVMRISALLLSCNLVLSIPLTWVFGIAGTAVATAAANLFGWAVILRTLGRHMKLPAWRVIPFPYYLRVLAVAGVSGGLAFTLRSEIIFAAHHSIALIVSGAVYVLIFLVTGSLSNVISRKDRRRLLGVLGWKWKLS